MNARSQLFEFSCESRQVSEIVSTIFHTVLIHRTAGKHTPKADNPNAFTIGSVGFNDYDCDFLDYTYVQLNSTELSERINRDIDHFTEGLKSAECNKISLEFFTKKKRNWPFQVENIPWEIWTIKIELMQLSNENERQVLREKLSDLLGEKCRQIIEIMDKPDYTPKLQNQNQIDTIYETEFKDIQPYLFKIDFQLDGTISQASVSTTMRRMIKDALSFG
jgi:autophagy-related protein 101